MGDCSKCVPARCCQYVSQEIDTPRSRSDFDQLLWQLAHQGVSIFVDEGDWHLSYETRCRFLGESNLCQIYETRPQVCREYSNDWCAYDSEYDFDLEFTTYEQLKEYVEIRFSKDGAQKVKRLRHRWKPKNWAPPQGLRTQLFEITKFTRKKQG